MCVIYITDVFQIRGNRKRSVLLMMPMAVVEILLVGKLFILNTAFIDVFYSLTANLLIGTEYLNLCFFILHRFLFFEGSQ